MDQEEVKKMLRNYILEKYKNASNSQDAEVYASLFHSDARWCPPSIPDYKGNKSIRYGFDAKNGNIIVETFVQEVDVFEDFGYVIGGATIEFYPHGTGDKIKYYHRVFWMFKNKDGAWKIFRQLWNVKRTIPIEGKIFKEELSKIS